MDENILRTVAALAALDEATTDKIMYMTGVERRYPGIMDRLVNTAASEADVAEEYGITQQAISKIKLKSGITRKVSKTELPLIMEYMKNHTDAEVMDKYHLKPHHITILRHVHLIGTMPDYKLGQQLRVPYTTIQYYRVRLGIETRK